MNGDGRFWEIRSDARRDVRTRRISSVIAEDCRKSEILLLGNELA